MKKYIKSSYKSIFILTGNFPEKIICWSVGSSGVDNKIKVYLNFDNPTLYLLSLNLSNIQSFDEYLVYMNYLN